MKERLRLLVIGLALTAALVAVLASPRASAAPAAFAALNPGGLTPLTETVRVNVVFVGMSPDTSLVASSLPTTASPKTRSKLFYGLDTQADLGITYTYDYRFYDTSTVWEDSFFGYLEGIATPAPRTILQNIYNLQAGARKVGQENHFIDAPSVEQWLIENPPTGVDPRSPTIFLISWWGRTDFIDHVYTKLGEPDPDTGQDFGARQSHKIVAWGGTAPDDEETGYGGEARRVWFYDLSAGPELWGGSFDITSADIDGDGRRDYRIPPIWDYTGTPPTHVHPAYGPARLETDLGKVIRYVGLNLLFTSSPLYPPYYTSEKLPLTVNLDVNTMEGWNQVDASERFITKDLFLQEVRELPTGLTPTDDYQDIKQSQDWNRCWKQFIENKTCYNDLHPGYASIGGFVNPFLVTARNRSSLHDDGAEYEATMVNFASGPPPKNPGFLGYADDNWLDGTQSGIFSFVYPDAVAWGYGLTTTMIHEYGHHSSVSHPHDGYDPTSGVDFGPTGDFYFAWLGDESNSMMSYIDLNWDFSQFDRDNSARHRAAGYAKVANLLAANVLAAPGAAAATAKLASADGKLAGAQAAFAAHDYLEALSKARDAYLDVRQGASLAGVPAKVTEPSTWTIIGPVKPGNGPNGKSKVAPYARDLDDRANMKRMYSP